MKIQADLANILIRMRKDSLYMSFQKGRIELNKKLRKTPVLFIASTFQDGIHCLFNVSQEPSAIDILDNSTA